MDVTCVALERTGSVRSVPEQEALALWREGGGPFWIHLRGGSLAEVAAWLEQARLGLGEEALDLLRAEAGETRIVPLAQAVFVAYPVPPASESWDPAHFGCLCLEQLVVTAQAAVPTLLDPPPLTAVKLREGTPEGVVSALALVHAHRLRHRIVAIRREGDLLSDRMDQDPLAVAIEDVLALKRRALALGGFVDEQLAILELLRASDGPVLHVARVRDTITVAIEITRATDRDLDRLERRAIDLQRRHESAQQDLANRRLGTLTVISAIFMPLSLIAGIYGMNFEGMPALHARWGYPLALGSMAVIAAGLTWYFRTRWFQPKGSPRAR